MPVAAFESLDYSSQMECLTQLAEEALSLYAIPDYCTIKLINHSENATFKVEWAGTGQKWALRVHRDGYHSNNGIASELNWLMELRRKGVVITPRPVPGYNGELIQFVEHPAMSAPRRVVLFDWEGGSEPGINEDLRGPFEILGEVTARMHQHVMNWKLPPGFERLTWDFDTSLGNRPNWGRWCDGLGVDQPIAGIFGRTVDLIQKRLEAYGKAPDRYGLIHCDLRLANLLVEGSDVKVIDFDDSGFGWFMYDAVTPLSFYEHHAEVPELISHWLEGYRRVRALPKQDEAEIPTFLMLRRLLLIAWIGSHRETDLAKSMGVQYTTGAVPLCEQYLATFSEQPHF